MFFEMCLLELMIFNFRVEELRLEMEQFIKDLEESWGLKEVVKVVCKVRKVVVMYIFLVVCVFDFGELEFEIEVDLLGIVKVGYDVWQ